MIPPVKSLVRYDKEVLVSTSKKAASGKDKLAKSGLKKSLPPVDPKASAQSQTEDILNSILPPRYVNTSLVHAPGLTFFHRSEWNEDGQLWVQYVSTTPATRLDVINLQEELDRKLQQRQVVFCLARFLPCVFLSSTCLELFLHSLLSFLSCSPKAPPFH